jgi:hypothetical protein
MKRFRIWNCLLLDRSVVFRLFLGDARLLACRPILNA